MGRVSVLSRISYTYSAPTTMKHQEKKRKPSPSVLAINRRPPRVDTSEWPAFPVFTAARLVCRECLHLDGDDSVLREIDSFLDELTDSLTLTTAYKISDGSLRLLQYLAAHESKTKDAYLRRWDVNAVTGQAAARGDLKTLKWVAESYLPEEFLTEVVAEAACNGHMQILTWMWENHRSRGYWGGVELAGAIRNHHQDVVDWLQAQVVLRPECAGYLFKPAAEYGNLGIVQWLYENFELDLVDAFNAAVLKGQLEVILWFLDHAEREGLDAADESVYMSPAEFGDLGMLKLFFGRGLVQEPVEVLEVAAGHGYLDIVKWLTEEQGIEDIGHAFDRAAEHGHLDVLKYLRETKADACIDSLLDGAAVAGYMGIVRWLHENTRARCTVQAMDGAAANGHLEIVQWLHANYTEGCTSLAMHVAATRGHLDVVKWLHENRGEGCRQDTMYLCACRGDLEMVKWLRANRSEAVDPDRAINMDVAAAFGYLDVVQWFHETRDEGCTSWAMDRAAGNGELDVVKWLHEHRREGCTADAMDDAATNGHLEVVKWLHDNREEGCTTKAIDGAAANSHLKVIKWLRSNRSERCSPLALEWLFSKPTRLDTAIFMFSEFPECRKFRLGPAFEVAWLKVVKWLIERAPSALEGCNLEVKSWNWHVCDWLRQHDWAVVSQDKVFSRFVRGA